MPPYCSLVRICRLALSETEFTKPASYEDPRRFPSRVIGLSFQGPRGEFSLPSGSRYLVSVVFAVKDFLKLFFRACRAPCETGAIALSGAPLPASGVPKGRRCMPSIVSLSKIFVRKIELSDFSRNSEGFRSSDDLSFVQ